MILTLTIVLLMTSGGRGNNNDNGHPELSKTRVMVKDSWMAPTLNDTAATYEVLGSHTKSHVDKTPSATESEELHSLSDQTMDLVANHKKPMGNDESEASFSIPGSATELAQSAAEKYSFDSNVGPFGLIRPPPMIMEPMFQQNPTRNVRFLRSRRRQRNSGERMFPKRQNFSSKRNDKDLMSSAFRFSPAMFFRPTDHQTVQSTPKRNNRKPTYDVSRTIHKRIRYDVPQIECSPISDGSERFSCPSPDRKGRYKCILDNAMCDGFIDCPHGEDEDRRSCMFFQTTKAHLDVLADALLRWARGRY